MLIRIAVLFISFLSLFSFSILVSVVFLYDPFLVIKLVYHDIILFMFWISTLQVLFHYVYGRTGEDFTVLIKMLTFAITIPVAILFSILTIYLVSSCILNNGYSLLLVIYENMSCRLIYVMYLYHIYKIIYKFVVIIVTPVILYIMYK